MYVRHLNFVDEDADRGADWTEKRDDDMSSKTEFAMCASIHRLQGNAALSIEILMLVCAADIFRSVNICKNK